ncbi:hypothetical protein ACFXD5_22655 [Streptomyces sp. NPDC059385]|uniref:hypothetical protein n=1 Tax=Streptomyces sp. NPDC059385 TaxID=3346817 RepID=UPI0036D1892E
MPDRGSGHLAAALHRPPALRAVATARYTVDARRQLLVRERRWDIEGSEQARDFARFRMLSPLELSGRLAAAGLDVVGLHDRHDPQTTAFPSGIMTVVARQPA